MLILLLAAYSVTVPLGVPVSFVTIAGALVLLALAARWHRGGAGQVIDIRRVLRGAPWQVVIFSLGMYLVVYGLRNAGLYEMVIDTDEPDRRLDLMHENIRKYGTISNTVAAAVPLSGTVVRKGPPTD